MTTSLNNVAQNLIAMINAKTLDQQWMDKALKVLETSGLSPDWDPDDGILMLTKDSPIRIVWFKDDGSASFEDRVDNQEIAQFCRLRMVLRAKLRRVLASIGETTYINIGMLTDPEYSGMRVFVDNTPVDSVLWANVLLGACVTLEKSGKGYTPRLIIGNVRIRKVSTNDNANVTAPFF